MADEEKKIIADDDWKAEAKREKERLKEKEKQQERSRQAGEPARPAGPLPPPTFDELVNMFVMQAMIALGKLQMPGQDKPVVDLNLAKHHIDMLEVIESKTRGNLSDDEAKGLKAALDQLHWLFVDEANRTAKAGSSEQ